MSDDGWVLVSESVPASGNPAPTLHHRNGCAQSNGRSQLVEGTPAQIAERLEFDAKCLKCLAVLA